MESHFTFRICPLCCYGINSACPNTWHDIPHCSCMNPNTQWLLSFCGVEWNWNLISINIIYRMYLYIIIIYPIFLAAYSLQNSKHNLLCNFISLNSLSLLFYYSFYQYTNTIIACVRLCNNCNINRDNVSKSKNWWLKRLPNSFMNSIQWCRSFWIMTCVYVFGLDIIDVLLIHLWYKKWFQLVVTVKTQLLQNTLVFRCIDITHQLFNKINQ